MVVKAARGVVGVLASVTLALAACGDPAPGPTTSTPKAKVPPVAPRPGNDFRTTGVGPEPPERGVWVGAWVKPDWPTATGRAAALEAFGQQTGAKLAIAHMYHQWHDKFPGPTEQAHRASGRLQMISWSGTDTRSITSGTFDDLIRQRAREIKEFGLPVLLRWRWEMDRPNLAASIHSPEDYVAAWKRIRGIFTEVGVTNAGWVWCPHVQGFVNPQRRGAEYYPGDDQVDWLCTDIYPGPDFQGFAEQMDAFMAFARNKPKPVMIGEFGVTTEAGDRKRGEWLREARRYIKTHPQIKAVVYFAAKQIRKPKYDSTFNDDPDGLAAFQQMVRDPHFTAEPPSMTPGVPAPSRTAATG